MCILSFRFLYVGVGGTYIRIYRHLPKYYNCTSNAGIYKVSLQYVISYDVLNAMQVFRGKNNEGMDASVHRDEFCCA